MATQELNEAAQAVLEEYGYSIDIDVTHGWDRRDFDPDHVTCRLAKDGQLMFRTEFRTELDDEFYDISGASVIDDCLDIKTKPAYQEQARKFDLKITELLKLKAEHKFTHRAEKKEVTDECEQLMAYRESFAPLQRAGVYANIPLIEENEKELAEMVQKIREVMKAQEAREAQEAEAGLGAIGA